jgi:hypothetical protein
MRIEKSTGGGDFQIAPAGDYQAVLVDMIDCGWKEQYYQGDFKGMAACFKPVFQITETMDNGDRYCIWHFPQYVKWNEKARWYKFLVSLLGKTRVDAIMEGDEFDPDSLIGINCDVTVVHTPDKADPDKLWANIEEIQRWKERMGPEIEPVGYVRQCDKPDWETEKRPTLSAYDEYPGDPKTGELDKGTTTRTMTAAQSTPRLATDAQCRAVKGIAKKIWGDEWEVTLAEHHSLPVEETSVAEASALIDHLRLIMAEQSAPQPVADVRTPDALLVPLMSEGPAIFGSDFMKHLNKLAKKYKGADVFKLTEAQAGQVLSDLRNTSPAKGLKAKADAIPSEELADDVNPFEDEESDGTTTAQQMSAFKTPEPAGAYPAN